MEEEVMLSCSVQLLLTKVMEYLLTLKNIVAEIKLNQLVNGQSLYGPTFPALLHPDTLYHCRLHHYVITVAVVFLCYSNSLHGNLLHDDYHAIVTNMDIRPESSLSQIFYNDFWGQAMSKNTSHKSYRPLTTLTFRLNFQLHGLEPFGYHLTNVCLHAVAAVLFMIVTQTTVPNHPDLTLIAGVLFALHPIHTEAISGVVGRADILCCIFYLLSFLSYTRSYISEWSRFYFGCSIFLSACAMISKEQGLTVLALLVVYEVVRNSPWNFKAQMRIRSSARRILLLGISATGLLVFRLRVMNWDVPRFTDQDNQAAFSNNLNTRIMTFSYIHSLNLYLLACPLTLSYDWSMNTVPLITSFTDTRNLLTLATIYLLTRLVIKACKDLLYKKSGHLLHCLGFLVIPYLPASNIFITAGFVIAERILYIPSVGYILLLVIGLQRLRQHRPRLWGRRLLVSALIIATLTWAGRTVIRNHVWKDRESLFRSGIESSPENAKMHYNYGNYLKDSEEKDRAIDHYRNALRLWPNYASAYNNLGTLLKSPQEAETMYREALRITPQHANALFNLGSLLAGVSGREAEAIKYLQAAIKCDPGSARSHFILAKLYIKTGMIANANGHFKSAFDYARGDRDIYLWLAQTLFEQQRYVQCWEAAAACLDVNRADIQCLRYAGATAPQLNMTSSASALYQRAVETSQDPELLYDAGRFHWTVNCSFLASRFLIEAYLQTPTSTSFMMKLAIALYRSGHRQIAANALKRILQKEPDNVEAVLLISSIEGSYHNHLYAIHILCDWLTCGKTSTTADRAEVHLQLAKHYRDANLLESSFRHFQISELLDGSVAEVHHNLAVFYHKMGCLKPARKHYSRAMELDNSNELIKHNLDKLDRSKVTTLQWTPDNAKLTESLQKGIIASSCLSNTSSSGLSKNSHSEGFGARLESSLFLSGIHVCHIGE